MELSDEELHAMYTLYKKRNSQQVLSLLRWQRTYRVDTDAFDRLIEYAVLQKHPNGTEKYIGFWSWSPKDVGGA